MPTALGGLLEEIAAAGLALSDGGGDLLMVKPRGRVTPELASRIRERKGELLAAVRRRRDDDSLDAMILRLSGEGRFDHRPITFVV